MSAEIQTFRRRCVVLSSKNYPTGNVSLRTFTQYFPRPCFAKFVSYDFNGRKLQPVGSKRPHSFEMAELQAFGQHLYSKWLETQRKPPDPILRYLVFEAQGKCAFCREQSPHYENAHIEPWAKSFCHHPHNLLRLCLNCHKSHGSDTKLLRAIKESALATITGTQAQRLYECDPSVIVGQAVFVLNGQAQLAVADGYDNEAMGFVSQKFGQDRCLVQTTGLLTAFDRLDPGKRYALSFYEPGAIVVPTEEAERNLLPGHEYFFQVLGRAESQSTLVVRIGETIGLR